MGSLGQVGAAVEEGIPQGLKPAFGQRLSHLQLLEAESIQIFREVAAEFQKPVMLYSIGKDSSVMLRLAQKAFFPGPIPFLCCISIRGTSFAR